MKKATHNLVSGEKLTVDDDETAPLHIQELVTDLKSMRNAVYEITNASNPYERTAWTKHACEVAHNVTEKYKKLLREVK